MQRLRTQATEVPFRPVLPSEVVGLQQRVQQLQTERDVFRQDGARASSGESIEEDVSCERISSLTRRIRAVDACQIVGDARHHCGRSLFGSVQVGGIGGHRVGHSSEVCRVGGIGGHRVPKLDTQSF